MRHYPLLFYFLRRDLKSRYLGSWGGGLWVLLYPLVLLAIYNLVFTRILQVRFAGVSETGFVFFWGLAMWPWFSLQEGLAKSIQAIPGNIGLIKKAAFPREILVYASSLSGVVVHGLGYLMFLGISMLWGAVTLSKIPIILAIFLVQTLLVVGFGLFLAAIQPFFKDLEHILPALLMLWMYLTPILYPITMVPQQWQFWLQINPLTGLIQLYRDAANVPIFQGWFTLGIYLVSGIVLVWVARKVFNRVEAHFEDFL